MTIKNQHRRKQGRSEIKSNDMIAERMFTVILILAIIASIILIFYSISRFEFHQPEFKIMEEVCDEREEFIFMFDSRGLTKQQIIKYTSFGGGYNSENYNIMCRTDNFDCWVFVNKSDCHREKVDKIKIDKIKIIQLVWIGNECIEGYVGGKKYDSLRNEGKHCKIVENKTFQINIISTSKQDLTKKWLNKNAECIINTTDCGTLDLECELGCNQWKLNDYEIEIIE